MIAPSRHRLTMALIRGSAGRAKCSCGWESEVIDGGMGFDSGGYSLSDATRDWKSHVLTDPVRLDPVVTPSMRPPSAEPPPDTGWRIGVAVSVLVALGVVFWL